MKLKLAGCAALVASSAFVLSLASAEDQEKEEAGEPAASSEAADRSEPKPLSENVTRALAYLAEVQNKDGGWGQGGGWRTKSGANAGRVEGEGVEDPPDIGNTSIALLAFMRAGESFEGGKYSAAMTKALQFLLAEVDREKDDTLYVTSVRDTQLQTKIGRYVDTFLAALVLSELKGKLPSESMEVQRAELLARVVAKIEKHQKDDGTFDGNGGWAAVLSQGIASKSLNRAWVAGGGVSDQALRKDNLSNAVGVVDGAESIAADAAAPGSAGIDLYRYAAQVGGLQENANINARRRVDFAKTVASADATEEEKERAKVELAAIEKNDRESETAGKAAVKQLQSDQFVAGFGNRGGEEFLSYMNLSEAMCAKGGKEWADWDQKITTTINGAQNEDGSWAGHHCITGRTFCTATALLTLMADRAPVPGAELDPDDAGDETVVTQASAAQDGTSKEGATAAAPPVER
ncbi:MAG: hypothetical protein ACR2RV_03225 [Verrucomicrobiales bacterium]